MPLNNTQEKINKQVERDLKEKVKLERRMVKDLNKLFNGISRDLFMFVEDTGTSQSSSLYSDDLRAIHNSQVRRVTNSFGTNITDFLEDKQNSKREPIIRDLNKISKNMGTSTPKLIQEIRGNTRIQSREINTSKINDDIFLISETIQKDLDDAILKAINDNPDGSPKKIAKAASKNFKKRSKSRADTIAASFTQSSAERSKQIERENFFNVRNGFHSMEIGLPKIDEESTWITIGDSVVRISHLEADNTKSKGGIFTVGGEKLKFPGDRSLGASASNTINCRCSAVTTIE